MKPIVIEQAPTTIIVQIDTKPVAIPIEIRTQHELFWKEQLKKNPTLRNGEVFIITNINQTSEELLVTVAKTDYKHYLYTLHHPDCDYPCKVLYTCAAIITSDQRIVFGQMNRLTSTPGRLQFTGGGLEESDLDGNRFSLKRNLSKEIKEEMGLDIDSSSIRTFIPKFIKHKGTHDFWAVIYEVAVNYSAQELHTLFLSHNQHLIEKGKQPEFNQLIFLPLEKIAIESFIKNETSPMVDYLAHVLLKYIDLPS